MAIRSELAGLSSAQARRILEGLPLGHIAQIKTVPGVKAVSPMVVFTSTYRTPGDFINAVAVDPEGNVWVTGSIYAQGDSGGNKGNADVFIAKYSPKGACLWRYQLIGPGDDRGKSIFDPAVRGHTDQYALKFVRP